jgi:hypothetical protein
MASLCPKNNFKTCLIFWIKTFKFRILLKNNTLPLFKRTRGGYFTRKNYLPDLHGLTGI